MTEAETTEESVREDITVFLRRNFPQIQMHGGTFSIDGIDLENGRVTVVLSGACSGCGISPMTIQAIKSRMVKDVDAIEEVVARTEEEAMGGTSTPSFADAPPESDGEEPGSDAPF